MKEHALIDLHIHSTFSDGKLTVAEIVDLYGQKGYSAIAITDHLADTATLTGKVTQKLNLSLSEGKFDNYLNTLKNEAARALSKYNMLLIPGVEVTLNSWSRYRGAHIVFLNVTRYINPNCTVEDLLIQNRDFFSIAAHPLWEESYEFKTRYLWDNRQQLAQYIDAWECATAHSFSQEVYLSGMPFIASSDFHHPGKFESWKSRTKLESLSTNCLFSQIRTFQIEPIWI